MADCDGEGGDVVGVDAAKVGEDGHRRADEALVLVEPLEHVAHPQRVGGEFAEAGDEVVTQRSSGLGLPAGAARQAADGVPSELSSSESNTCQ